MKSLCLSLVGFAVFFSLRGFAVNGGDTLALLDPKHPTYRIRWGEPFVFDYREPLANLLVLKVFHITDNLTLAFELVSSFCGGIWLALLLRFRGSALFWAANLLSAVTLVFVGHKEFYAPAVVSLTLYFLALAAALRPRPAARPWHVVAAWGLAFLAHKMALFYALGMLLLLLDPATRRLRPLPRRDMEKALVALILIALLSQVPAWLELLGLRAVAVVSFDNRILELLTLPKCWADPVAEASVMGAFQLFYFGSLDHFRFYFGFWLMGAPVGLALIAAKWRVALSVENLPLLCCCFLSLTWTFFWHPHMGWRDWDLFCAAAVPVNLLGGLLFSERTAKNARKGKR